MHISCQTYLPTPSSGGSSSSNSRKTLRAMAERSEEAHHVAEFHTGRGDWRWSLADPVSIGDTHTTWVVKRSLTSPFFFSSFLSFFRFFLFKEAQYVMSKQRTSIIEHVWAVYQHKTHLPFSLGLMTTNATKDLCDTPSLEGPPQQSIQPLIHLWGGLNRFACY